MLTGIVIGFVGCAVVSVLFPAASRKIHDGATRLVAWVRAQAGPGSAE